MSKKEITSSKHLADDSLPLSELEFALTTLNNAFTQWIVRCSNAACEHELNAIEILTLHNIHQRENQPRINDICFMLNIQDTHTVNYALKKLIKNKLIKGTKRGKEVFYQTTREGSKACEEYRKIRESCLINSLKELGDNTEKLSDIATTLRALSGLYDQAARSAVAMS